jgi:hypothetical protein
MEETCSSDKYVDMQGTIQFYIPEDRTLRKNCPENLNSYMIALCYNTDFRLLEVTYEQSTIITVIILIIITIYKGLYSDTELHKFYLCFYTVVLINLFTALLF